MSVRVFRSPRSGSVAAATAPARLAREWGKEVLWQERPDGLIEVATLSNGTVDRYVVQADGSVTPAGPLPPLSGLRRGTPIAVAGGLVIGAAVAMHAVQLPGAIGIGFAGWMLVVIGVGFRSLAGEISTRVKGHGDWIRPTDLHGWVPRSTEQLRAVEEIADDHDGMAFIRDIGTRTVDVRAIRGGQLNHFWVDEAGRTELTEKTSVARRYFVDRMFQGAATVLFIGVLVLGFGFNRWQPAAVLGVGIAFVMIGGWVNHRFLDLERRAEHMVDDGVPWIEIITKVENADSE